MPVRTWVLVIVWALIACDARAAKEITSVQRYAFDAPSSEASEISGITFLGGGKFLAVGDEMVRLHRLKIGVNKKTGGIDSFAIAESAKLRNRFGTEITEGDLEGIAFAGGRASVFIANEADSSIHEFGLKLGNEKNSIAAIGNTTEFGVFSNPSTNQGLESLARSPRGGWVWTANQDALPGDGGGSTLNNGETIRIQRLTSKLVPAGQWAYRLDAGNDASTPWSSLSENTMSDLTVLPDGSLVAMEKASGSGANGAEARIRLYQIGLLGATPLNGGAVDGAIAASKTLLFEAIVPDVDAKFEGITYGPRLSNGDLSLLLVEDNSGGTRHPFWALRVSGVKGYRDPLKTGGVSAVAAASAMSSVAMVPEPGMIWGMVVTAMLLGARRHDRTHRN